MSVILPLQEKYLADADAMSTKSRFGFFSILPNHSAAITYFPNKKYPKDSNGRVQTQPRNIYSGSTSTGSLKKTFFSYVPSPFHGSAYEDPGKNSIKKQLLESKKWEGKELFKPAKLNKTLIRASYEHLTDHQELSKKNYKNSEGKVITKSPNIQTNPSTKIEYNRIKNFKYSGNPDDEIKVKAKKEKEEQIKLRREEPFRRGSPVKQYFSTNVQAFYDANLDNKEKIVTSNKSLVHEAAFRSTCTSPDRFFNQITYKIAEVKQKGVKNDKQDDNDEKGIRQVFKLTKVEQNSKPCPSISCSKLNLLRSCR